MFCRTIDDCALAAEDLLKAFPGERIFAFYGTMGAGKTTLIKSICSYLSVPDIAKSPSFAIINEYESSEGISVYHFDFYRINRQEEAYDIGFEEYLYSGNYCFIEWAEKVEELLPSKYVRVDIEETENKERNITYTLIKNYS
jgi:tRNA threonylcarbamoyladenosine biosynthesis protein TsaE